MCCGSWGHKELDTTERLNEQLIYNVVLVSDVCQSDSDMHIHVSILFEILSQ